MADDLNALLSSRSGQLPAPVVLNPLAAMSSAVQTAGSIYDLKQKQANEAWGSALQQATDPKTGVVDFDAAQRIAAQMGPVAQMGMATNLQNASNIKGQQLEQASALYNTIGRLSASGISDASDANIASIRAQAVNAKLPAGALTEIDRIAAIPDENQRKMEFYKHNLGALDAAQRLHQTLGQTTQVDYGDVKAPTTIYQPTPNRGGVVAVGPGTTVGPPPATMTTVTRWENPDGTEAQPGAAGASKVTRQLPITAAGVPQGAQPQVVTPPTGGSTSPASSAPPIPPPAGSKVVIPGQYVPPGTTPPTTPPAPATAPATPASPFGTGAFGGASTVAPAPTTPATPPAGTTPPASAPAPAGIVTNIEPPTGLKEEQDLSAKQWATDRAEAGNFQQRIWPMVQSYALLTGGDLTTGKGAEAVNTVKGYLQTLGSIFTPADLQSIRQAKWEELGKYLQQAVNTNPFAGGSNDKLAAAISGNPNTHISTLANTDVVKSMIALERAKQAAVAEFQNSGQPASAWADFKAKWQTGHDVRVFATDMMDDKQVREMLSKMSPAEQTAYQNTLKLIRDNPSIMNAAPMPHAQAAPAAAPTRALAMAQPQGNPLLYA
jgi:hypothetical protein